MAANCHPGGGNKEHFLNPWSHTLCPCGPPFFVGLVLPDGSDLPQGWRVERKVSLPRRAGWEALSLCFIHEGDQCGSADVMGVCRILLPDSWHIGAPFPRVDGPGRRRRSPCFTRLAGLERGRCTARKARTGSKWEALLITWGQMVCSRLSGTLCPK